MLACFDRHAAVGRLYFRTRWMCGWFFNVEATKNACFASIPEITVDRINTPELAEQTIAQEKADFVAIGRGMLADPAVMNKIDRKADPLLFGLQSRLHKSVTKKAIYCVQNPFGA